MSQIPSYSYYLPEQQKVLVNFWAARLEFPNVSIPEGVDLPELGLYVINIKDFPVDTPDEGKYWSPGALPDLINGKYYQSWEQVAYPPEESEDPTQDPATK